MPRQQDDRQLWRDFLHLSERFKTIHARHAHVHDHHIELRTCSVGHGLYAFQTIHTVGSRGYIHGTPAQAFLHDFQEFRFVIYH